MFKRTSVLFLLSFLLLAFIGTSFCYGSSSAIEAKSKGRKVRPASGADFVRPDLSASMSLTKGVISRALNSSVAGNILGETMYDLQTERSMTRQAEHRNTGRLHFAWTDLDNPDPQDNSRELAYNSVDLAANCAVLHGTDGAKGQAGMAGYASLDVYFGTAFAMPAAHVLIGDKRYPAVYWDFGWQMGLTSPFGTFTVDYPTNVDGYEDPDDTPNDNWYNYPKVEYQNGTEEVLHMVCRESFGDTRQSSIAYYRRVGSYGFDGSAVPNGTWSDMKLVDTSGHGDAQIVASTISDKVAIVWLCPVASWFRGPDPGEPEYEEGWLNDVYYIVSTNQGADWMTNTPTPSLSQEANAGMFTEVNVTNYVHSGEWLGWETAWNEVQALWDSNDDLHIVYGTRFSASQGYVFWRDCGLWHWDEVNQTNSLVYRPPQLTQTPPAYGCAVGYTGMNDLGGYSLSECVAGPNAGNIYVSFTRFGHDGAPCDDIDLVTTASPGAGNLNGYLYYAASDDGGLNWDRPQRITDRTPTMTGCYPDSTNEWACNTEVFGSLARYSRTETCGDDVGSEVMDIVYTHDLAPGALFDAYSGEPVVVTAQPVTSNPVTWQTVPCRDVVYEAIWTDDLIEDGFGLCHSSKLLAANPGAMTYDTITCINPGLLANDFTVTATYEDGDAWISAVPSAGTIASSRGDTIDIEFIFTAPTDVGDPVTIGGTIVINNLATDSPREIPVCLTVASEFYLPDTATIATTCKQLRVWSTGRISGSGDPDVSLDYIDECDTFGNAAATSYMYGGSIVFAWDDGTVQICHDMFTNNAFEDGTARSLSNLTLDTSDPDYIKATGNFTTFDSTINGTVEYYIPQGDTACEFVIQKLYVTSASGAKNNVALGYMWDWDVPSDSGSDNTSFADEARQLLYCSAEEADDDGEAEALAECGVEQQSDDRFAGVRILPTGDVGSGGPKNLMTLDNDTWMYSSGPYGDDAPLPAGPTYDLMVTTDGFIPWEPAAPSVDSVYVDLSMLATFGEFNLTEGTPIELGFAMITGRTGEANFLDEVDKAYEWAKEKGLIVTTCCVVPGDANGDEAFNVGDAVFTINNVFKGGPLPECQSAGDANTDNAFNVGDAVFTINNVFKGGPLPEPCGTSTID